MDGSFSSIPEISLISLFAKLNICEFFFALLKYYYLGVYPGYMRRSIQEWTKWILWKTAFKKCTWSTLEYFVS